MRRRQRAAETGATVEATSGTKRARRETAETAETAAIALGGGMFSPGQPIRPTPGLSGPGGAPRQWAFPPGYNIAQFPRATEQTSFAQLRGLAALYDGIQLCERVYFDLLGRLEPRVLPRVDLLAAGEDATAPCWREPARRIEAFLESPDRAQDLRSWLVAFVRDLLEIDAVAIYSRRSRSGALYALELVAGDTIKPLLDGGGRQPLPPAPAYQQFLYGAPAGWYSRDELDYLRETARTESPYGLSRVERIILRVNQALRKQGFDLARFTDGVTPLGVIQPPATLTWTPEQLELFERAFNGLLAGNDQMRVRARALPPGATWQALSGDDPLIEFDRFLLNITVAAFGLTMDELGFTETSNRSHRPDTGERRLSPGRRPCRRAGGGLSHAQGPPVARRPLHRHLHWLRGARRLRHPRRSLRQADPAWRCLARRGRALAPSRSVGHMTRSSRTACYTASARERKPAA